ncbi:MAG: hypothetical protein ACRDH6_03955 [Actinomycetota bacterium]
MRTSLLILVLASLITAVACSDDPRFGSVENGAIPGVEPSVPQPGATAELSFEEEASGSDPTVEYPRPRVLLARTPSEGQRAARHTGVPGASAGLRFWDAYPRRSLVAIIGGAQPDSGYQLQIERLRVSDEGETLEVIARVEREDGFFSQVISVPWRIVSVAPAVVAVAERCVLTLEGQRSFRSVCA